MKTRVSIIIIVIIINSDTVVALHPAGGAVQSAGQWPPNQITGFLKSLQTCAEDQFVNQKATH